MTATRLWDFTVRYGTFAAIVVLALLCLALAGVWRGFYIPLIVLVPLALLGVWNVVQTKHTLMRNYPVVAHFRWISERLRPFLRQYIVEDDLEGRPYDRDARSQIYRRAKDAVDVHPFGTELDTYASEYEWITHSVSPAPVAKEPFRVTVGGPQCSKPYSASVLNISAMSFGALGAHAVEALNWGAKRGGFYHDTGEGGFSRYHRIHGGDIVWEIGSGYFGCRDKTGHFDPDRFAEQACEEQVKMVEIKLSQGAKPGHGGVLPGAKVTPEIAEARGVEVGEDCVSPSGHSAFSSPVELLEFVAKLRELSGGKPAGFKMCVGHPHEVLAICKAMQKTGIKPDFIVVDGGEGGTGAAPEEFSNHLGMPLREGLIIMRNALVGTGLRDDIRLAASGKVVSGFSVAANMAIGADWCNAARAFMFSVGCVMSMRCHTGKCPTGVATQDPDRQRGLVIPDKAERVHNYHRHTVHALSELVAAAGLSHPTDFQPHHLAHRLSPVEVRSIDEIYPFLEPNVLLDDPDSTAFAHYWRIADPDSFAPKRS